MGWFSDAVDSISDAVDDVVNTVNNAVTEGVESVGSAIQDGLTDLGKNVARIPIIGADLKNVCSWLGGASSGFFKFTAATIKTSFDILGATFSGGIRFLGGILSDDSNLIEKGWLRLFYSFGGGILYISGTFIGLIQRVFGSQKKERNLTADEKERLKKVFKKSLNYFNIRVVDGWQGVFTYGDTNFTLGNTIYLKSDDFSTLVHECVHVWQFQNHGSDYTAQALIAQHTYKNAYDWEKEILEEGKTNWVDFNVEAQASFIETIWEKGVLKINSQKNEGDGIFFELEEKQQNFGSANVIAEFVSGNSNEFTSIAMASVNDLRNP